MEEQRVDGQGAGPAAQEQGALAAAKRAEELEAALRDHAMEPGEPSVEFRLAVLLHGSGRHEEAARAFAACVEACEAQGKPSYYLDAGRLGRSASLLAAGDPRAALDGLGQVGASARLWLGELFDAQGLGNAAREALR